MLNDVWFFDLSALQWIFLHGDGFACSATGIYGQKKVTTIQSYPPTRWQMIMVIDISTQTLYMHGGTNGSLFDDLWAFNIREKTWTWIDGTATLNSLSAYPIANYENMFPSSRRTHSAAVDQHRRFFYIFGGLNSCKFLVICAV